MHEARTHAPPQPEPGGDQTVSTPRTVEAGAPPPPPPRAADVGNGAGTPAPTAPPSPPSPPTPRGTTTSVLIGEDSFEWQGVTYRLGPINFKIESMFEQRCERNEVQAIERRQGDVSPLMFAAMVDAFCNRLGSRRWAWDGMPCLEARSTPEGEKDLFFFVLYHYNPAQTLPPGTPPISKRMAEEIWDNEGKWLELRAKIMRLSDPNLSAPTPE